MKLAEHIEGQFIDDLRTHSNQWRLAQQQQLRALGLVQILATAKRIQPDIGVDEFETR